MFLTQSYKKLFCVVLSIVSMQSVNASYLHVPQFKIQSPDRFQVGAAAVAAMSGICLYYFKSSYTAQKAKFQTEEQLLDVHETVVKLYENFHEYRTVWAKASTSQAKNEAIAAVLKKDLTFLQDPNNWLLFAPDTFKRYSLRINEELSTLKNLEFRLKQECMQLAQGRDQKLLHAQVKLLIELIQEGIPVFETIKNEFQGAVAYQIQIRQSLFVTLEHDLVAVLNDPREIKYRLEQVVRAVAGSDRFPYSLYKTMLERKLSKVVILRDLLSGWKPRAHEKVLVEIPAQIELLANVLKSVLSYCSNSSEYASELRIQEAERQAREAKLEAERAERRARKAQLEAQRRILQSELASQVAREQKRQTDRANELLQDERKARKSEQNALDRLAQQNKARTDEIEKMRQTQLQQFAREDKARKERAALEEKANRERADRKRKEEQRSRDLALAAQQPPTSKPEYGSSRPTAPSMDDVFGSSAHKNPYASQPELYHPAPSAPPYEHADPYGAPPAPSAPAFNDL